MKKLIVCLSAVAVMAAFSAQAGDAKASAAKTGTSKQACSACCSSCCDGKMAKKVFMSPKASEQVWVAMHKGAAKANS